MHEIDKDKFMKTFESFCDAYKEASHIGLYEVASERVDIFGSPRTSYVDGYKDGWSDAMTDFREQAEMIFDVSTDMVNFVFNTNDVLRDQIRKSNETAEKQ